MNKIILGAIIGVIGYEVCNFWFDMGKARMLGILLDCDITAKEAHSIISSSSHPRSKFIAKSASFFQKIES